MSRPSSSKSARADSADATTEGGLGEQVRHFDALAQIAQAGLSSDPLDDLLHAAGVIIARALRVEFCEILQLQPDGRQLRLVAGVGWEPGSVGRATVDVDHDSQAGFTLICGESPVVVEDLGREQRFKPPPLLHRHGVVCGMSAVIPGDGNLPFGVLGVHGRSPRVFSADERRFLCAVVSTLAAAVHRRRTEESLRDSHARLQSTLEAVEVGTWEWHPDTDDLYRSPTLLRMHGCCEDEHAGTLDSFLEDVHPDDRGPLRAALQAAVGGTEFDARYRVVRADGAIGWLQASGRVVRDAHGRVRRLVGIGIDISARQRSEETQARLAAIVASSPDAIIGLAPDGAITTWNDGAERIYGYSAAEMLGKSMEDLAPEEARGRIGQLLGAIARGNALDSAETVHRRKDGTAIAIWLVAAPIVDAQGAVIGASLIARDITDRKRAERALRESEQRFRLIAEHAVDLVYMTDLSGRFVYLNGAFERLLGYRPRELLGATLADLVEGDGLEGAGAEYTVREFRMRRRGGPPLWMEGSSHRVDSEAGAYVIGIVRDIHARKSLETKLEHDANHDALTGLPNRTLFLDRLQHAMDRVARQGEDYAVCVLDLDDFKLVNDRLGHIVGDQLLVQFAKRVNGCLRPNDTFARFGGDEFLLLLEDVGGMEGALQVVRRILSVLNAPFAIEGHLVRSGASIGVALADPGYHRAEDAVRDADAALYRVKDRGKGGMALFDPSMRKTA